jgi:hypothetical protein
MSAWYILNTVKDSFGKEWYSGECDPLHQFIKMNKLELTIEYITEEDKLFYICKVTRRVFNRSKKQLILDIKDTKPMSDSDILMRLKNIVRNEKIDKLLK